MVVEGYVLVIVEFEVGFDVDKVFQEVCDKVDIVCVELLFGSDEFWVNEVNILLFLVFIVVLFGLILECELVFIVCKLKDDVEVFFDVLEVKIGGD